MLRDTLFILRKDLKFALSAKETLLWVFIMPIIFFFFIGTISGGSGGMSGPTKPSLALEVGENPGPLLDQLKLRLEEQDFRLLTPADSSLFGGASRRLILPAGLSDSLIDGRAVTLGFKQAREGNGAIFEEIRAGRAAYTFLADLLAVGVARGELSQSGLDSLNALPRPIQLEVRPAGERQHIPLGFQQAIPGTLVMFILMIMCTSGAVLLVIERRQGLLRRLGATPIAMSSVVLGKLGGKFVLGLIQIAFGMLAGTLLFRMDWGPNLPGVILLLLCYGVMMAALGMLLGCLARSEGVAVAIGVIAANVLAALGGCWWPIEVVPQWMQKLQLFLPTGWAMDGLHRLISFGQAPAEVLPHLAAMLALALVLFLLSLRFFRYE